MPCMERRMRCHRGSHPGGQAKGSLAHLRLVALLAVEGLVLGLAQVFLRNLHASLPQGAARTRVAEEQAQHSQEARCCPHDAQQACLSADGLDVGAREVVLLHTQARNDLVESARRQAGAGGTQLAAASTRTAMMNSSRSTSGASDTAEQTHLHVDPYMCALFKTLLSRHSLPALTPRGVDLEDHALGLDVGKRKFDLAVDAPRTDYTTQRRRHKRR